MSSRTFFSSILLVLLLFSYTFAQQVKQRPNDTGWLLEITYLKGAPPAYERVRWAEERSVGDWFGRFGHVAGWQLPVGALPVRAVRLLPRLKDETVTIKVSVLRGAKYMDAEESVGTYQLRENETVAVKLLQNFGVEPFELRAFKTVPLVANQPAAVNKITAVEVVAIEPVAADTPEYRLTLRNLSTKTIEALHVAVVSEGRGETTWMPQGLEGKPLMIAGETIQIPMPLPVSAGGTMGTYAPVVPIRQQFVIRSAVFADGTSEGVADRAIQSGVGFQSVKFGRRVEMQRALPLFAAALESAAAISSDGVSKFRAQLEEINLGIADAELIDLQQRFPARDVKVQREWVEFGLHIMRTEMLERLARYEDGPKRQDFRSWLLENRERYSNWLARLEQSDAPQP